MCIFYKEADNRIRQLKDIKKTSLLQLLNLMVSNEKANLDDNYIEDGSEMVFGFFPSLKRIEVDSILPFAQMIDIRFISKLAIKPSKHVSKRSFT